ncbi:MAG: YicC family protein [Bdellovibrionaceae bacterium]|nr:YicC family protein [Pseudobdellovibrionaceae bacterium]
MKSMTGFGRSKRAQALRVQTVAPVRQAARATKKDGRKPQTVAGTLFPEASIRSVNGRFLEIRIHMPREWTELEGEVRSMIQRRIARGTVDVYLSRAKQASTAVKVEVDQKLAHEWMLALKSLAKEAGLKTSEIPFDAVIRAPDILKVVVDDTLSDSDRKEIMSAVADAIDSLDRERLREGAETQRELLSLIGALEAAVRQVSDLAEQQPDDIRVRLKSRMDRLGQSGLQGLSPDDARFHQEVALLVDRGDIREEIARLSAHLRVYRDLVTGKEAAGVVAGKKNATAQVADTEQPIGKTLDFYAQELLREVNTVGSKSQNAELTRIVVEAKTLVEKIREQVQNVE